MKRRSRVNPTLLLFLLGACALSLVLVACGGGGSSSTAQVTSGNSSGESEGESSSSQYQARFEELISPAGYKQPPATGPKAQKGKKVWVLSCEQANTACSGPANAMMTAGKELGWEMTLFDTKFDPSLMAEGVRKAIAAGAEGILTYLADCELMKAPLEEAKKDGVFTSTGQSIDCEPAIYDASVTYVGGNYEEWLPTWAGAQAATAIAGTEGKLKLLAIAAPSIPSGKLDLEGLEKEVATCAGCEMEVLEFQLSETGAQLQQKVQQALISNPEINAVNVTADSYYTTGVEGALRAAGRIDNTFVSLAEGNATIMEQLRNGELESAAGVGIPAEWEAYSAVDNLNRLFAGEKPASSGIGLQAFDQENNVSESGPFEPPVDFKSAYRRVWGVGG